MLITRRSDYALRICRALKDGKTHSVREICEKECIPKAFAYKIIREMEINDIVNSERGNKGGYYLNRSLDNLTVYDIVSITEDDMAIIHCMKEECERNPAETPCNMHCELERVQGVVEEELKSRTIAELLQSSEE